MTGDDSAPPAGANTPSQSVSSASDEAKQPGTQPDLDTHALYGGNPAILICNDDGLDPGSAIVLDLAAAMVRKGHRVVVCAPGENNSACGQKITLGKELQLQRHRDLEVEYGGETPEMLTVFSLHRGSPADCVIVAIEPRSGILSQLGLRPLLTLSGVNVGPNLGPDISYSGTFGAARQSAMYGIPAVASSLAEFGKRSEDPEFDRSCVAAVAGVAKLAAYLLETLPDVLPDAGRLKAVARNAKPLGPREAKQADAESVRQAFAFGDVLVNVNFPPKWDGVFEACVLDGVFYRDVVKWGCDNGKLGNGSSTTSYSLPSGIGSDACSTVTIAGGMMNAMLSADSDALATSLGRAAICTLSTWPATHPFAVSPEVLDVGMWTDAEVGDRVHQGIPTWMVATTHKVARM